MEENVLLLSNKSEDLQIFQNTLGPKGFKIHAGSPLPDSAASPCLSEYSAIIADYDQIDDHAFTWLRRLRKNRSRACFILYGKRTESETVSELLQSGAYSYIPRPLLSKRIYDTLLDGLENRKAFVEILRMIDELKVTNQRLEREKTALKRKNSELRFINRLSREVAYDLSWDGILQRIVDTGLSAIADPALLAILYRIDNQWHLALYAPIHDIGSKYLETFILKTIEQFSRVSGQKILRDSVACRYIPAPLSSLSAESVTEAEKLSQMLSLQGKPTGMIVLVPGKKMPQSEDLRELMATMSNILAMSLKNAQEYYALREMTIRDGLTDLFNRKGFKDFIEREFQRAKRYHTSLSLVMIDVDNFKQINDVYGHQAGDHILKELSRRFLKSVRNADIIARYGGDEFAMILPETDLSSAEKLMNRILLSVRNQAFRWKTNKLYVDISYGISTSLELGALETEEDLILKADSRLYLYKNRQSRQASMERAG
jgi:diguanylate cyclase (GGDEF)-like protein